MWAPRAERLHESRRQLVPRRERPVASLVCAGGAGHGPSLGGHREHTLPGGLRAPAARCRARAGPQHPSARPAIPPPAAESSLCCFKHSFPISKRRLVRKISPGCLNFYQGLQKRGGEGGEAGGFPKQDGLLQSKTLFKGKRESTEGGKTSLLENTGAAVCALGFFFPPPSLAFGQSSYYWPHHNKLMGWEREVSMEGSVWGGRRAPPSPPLPPGGGNPAPTPHPQHPRERTAQGAAGKGTDPRGSASRSWVGLPLLSPASLPSSPLVKPIGGPQSKTRPHSSGHLPGSAGCPVALVKDGDRAAVSSASEGLQPADTTASNVPQCVVGRGVLQHRQGPARARPLTSPSPQQGSWSSHRIIR